MLTVISCCLSVQSGLIALYLIAGVIVNALAKPNCLGKTYFARCLACSICARESGLICPRDAFDNQEG